MGDTRTIYLHTGIETFSSDPSDSQYVYLDMSDYDSLNPQYQSTIKLSSGVAGIYESTKAKITLTFKGENSGRDARADWVNKYAERINKISVNTTENKSAVFNKSAVVSEVEFIDTPYIDGSQVIIEVTMFGRWQSALTILDTLGETYDGGTKTYLGEYLPSNQSFERNYILTSNLDKTETATDIFYTSVPTSKFSGKTITLSVQLDYDNISSISGEGRLGFLTYLTSDTGINQWIGAVNNPNVGNTFHGRISATLSLKDINIIDLRDNRLPWGIIIEGVAGDNVTVSNPKLEIAEKPSGYTVSPEEYELKTPHYSYNYTYGNTTLQNQIALPKDRNRFMLAINSQYSVATITLSANGKRATISTSRLSANSSLSSDFVAYDITAFVDTDKFLLLNSGLVASVVWDNLTSQYAVLYQIMNSVGDTPADISVTTTGGQHIPFKLYTYSIQDFI